MLTNSPPEPKLEDQLLPPIDREAKSTTNQTLLVAGLVTGLITLVVALAVAVLLLGTGDGGTTITTTESATAVATDAGADTSAGAEAAAPEAAADPVFDPAFTLAAFATLWDNADWAAMEAMSNADVVATAQEWRQEGGYLVVDRDLVPQQCTMSAIGEANCELIYAPPEGFGLIFLLTVQSTADGGSITQLTMAGDAG